MLHHSTRVGLRSRARLLAAGLLAAASLLSAPTQAQMATVLVAQPGDDTKPVSILVGQSQIVRPPWPVARVSVTDPEIADVEALTPEQVLVLGKKPGTTDLVMWSKDEKVWRARLDVGIDVDRIKSDLNSLFPGSDLRVASVQNVLVISGQLRRVEDAGSLKDFLEKTKLPYMDKTGVAGVQQVMIRVRVAEVQRSVIRTLGINSFYWGNDAQIGVQPGPVDGGAINPVSTITPGSITTTVNPAVSVFASIPSWKFSTFLQAMQENQYLRILAEPSLKCISGEEASFLAGGEFPIPVVQGNTGGTNNSNSSITVVYKEFGVRLKFRPTVLGDNTIRLQVAPEVSELSDVGAVTLQGFRIPGLLTRRAETTLELKSGQTFAIAGLLSQRADGRNSRVPGVGDLPIIGALFRSVRYNSGETEMVVMVTADLVEPVTETAKRPFPGATNASPNDWELYCQGKLDSDVRPKVSPADAAWMHEKGLDQLRGPGAWVSYDQPPAPGQAQMRPADKPAAK